MCSILRALIILRLSIVETKLEKVDKKQANSVVFVH